MSRLDARTDWRKTLVALLFFAFASQAAALPMIVLDVGGQGPNGSVAVGDSVLVTITADEIPLGSDGKGLFGFGFRISYEPSGLSSAAPVVDPLWTGSVVLANDLGSVGASANRLGQASGPAGSGIVLATVSFTRLAPGTHSLQLEYFTAAGDNALFDGTVLDGDPASFFTTGSIPEPSLPTLLLVAALPLTRWIRRR